MWLGKIIFRQRMWKGHFTVTWYPLALFIPGRWCKVCWFLFSLMQFLPALETGIYIERHLKWICLYLDGEVMPIAKVWWFNFGYAFFPSVEVEQLYTGPTGQSRKALPFHPLDHHARNIASRGEMGLPFRWCAPSTCMAWNSNTTSCQGLDRALAVMQKLNLQHH